MIFITLGSQKFQFNRILQEVDRLIENGIIADTVFAQVGNSDYVPRHYGYKKFLNRDEFSDMQDRCDIVITHGGTGAIIGALKKGKKVIAVPRLAKYGEHVDDHQLQLLHQFDEMHLIEACYEIEHLADAYNRLLVTDYNTYVSNTNAVITSIENSIFHDVIDPSHNRGKKYLVDLQKKLGRIIREKKYKIQ